MCFVHLSIVPRFMNFIWTKNIFIHVPLCLVGTCVLLYKGNMLQYQFIVKCMGPIDCKKNIELTFLPQKNIWEALAIFNCTYEELCFLSVVYWSYLCETIFPQLFFCVSVDHFSWWSLITILHVASSHLCTQSLFTSYFPFHSSFQASITLCAFSRSQYIFCTHFAITSYSYWFYSSVMRFTFPLDFFEHLPPCHQAVGIILDGVTSSVCIVILFFPLELSFSPLLHCTGLLFSLFFEYASLVCLYCIWNFTFLYPLVQNLR